MTTEPDPDAGTPTLGRTLDAALLEILCCPACRGAFEPARPDALTCTVCGRRYPVRNGIPVLLVDEATLPGHSDAPAGR